MEKIAYCDDRVYFSIDFKEKTNDIIELMKKKVNTTLTIVVKGQPVEIETEFLHFIH